MNTNERAKNATLGWVFDASHSWLAVTLDTEHGLPQAESFGSEFSFLDITGDNFAGIVYLEEDADAPRFLKHFGLDGESFNTYELPDDNTIRDLPTIGKLTQDKIDAWREADKVQSV